MGILNRAGRTGFLLTLLFLGSQFSSAAAADILQKKTIASGDAPVVIRSNSLEIDNKKGVVTFIGSVEARKEDMLIRCQRMLVYYEEKGQAKPDDQSKGFQIDRIVAKGDVKIDRAEGGTATADEAVYYEKEEKLVLQGKPVVKQGEDFVEGSVITLFLKEDRSVVEGGDDRKVRAVISPKNRKR